MQRSTEIAANRKSRGPDSRVRGGDADALPQVFRFGIAGIITLSVDYALLYALTSLLGVNYLVSATASFLVASVCNYFMSSRFVFQPGRFQRSVEFGAFMTVTLIGLALNSIVLYVLVDHIGVNYLVAKGAAVFVVTLWNFLGKKRAVFLH